MWLAPWRSGLTICLVLGWSSLSIADEPVLRPGRWAVESVGMNGSTRLSILEIRTGSRSGEAELIAFDRGEDGEARPWGRSRIDRKASGPASGRWFVASWPSGPSTTQIQLRPESAGRLVAILRDRPNDRGAGEKVRQVVLSPEPVEGPPVLDGPVFRFEADGRDGSMGRLSGVFVARSDGTGSRPVALPDGFAEAAYPSWSADGQWIAFAGFDARGRDPLIRIAPAGGGPSTAVAAGSNPTWSRDGSRIAYVASGRVDYGTDWSSPGRNDERIESVTLRGPKAGEIEVIARGIWPRWSPTDDRLAFVARQDANWDIYLRSTDGLGLTRLTDDPALDTQPVWTADGRSVVFLSDRGNRWDLFRVAAQGRGATDRLTDHVRREDHPSISPDGKQVAFLDGRGSPDGSIQILSLDRGTVRNFPEHPDGDRDPAWSPDGRSIAFVSRRPGPLLPSGGPRP